jgi:hypothetical protein
MPYVVFRGLPPPWRDAIEVLTFQFGSLVFGKWKFSSVSNATNPLATPTGQLNLPPVLQPVMYQQMPDDGSTSRTLSFDRKVIRYAAYHGKRYFIDLSNGTFDSYLARFSTKTRNTLRRKVRRFTNHAAGTLDFRSYGSPEEMIEFRRHAIAISLLTYQRKIGWAFPETEEFNDSLIEEAARGQVCGFLLMHGDTPVAYAFCKIEADIITYALLGHDPTFRRFSPGTVLLVSILERLFTERRYRVFDFGGMAAEYKLFFSTGSIDYIKMIWLPTTPKHLLLVTAHFVVRQGWQAASWLKRAGGPATRGARALLRRRVATRSPIPDLVSETVETEGAAPFEKKTPQRARPQPVRR